MSDNQRLAWRIMIGLLIVCFVTIAILGYLLSRKSAETEQLKREISVHNERITEITLKIEGLAARIKQDSAEYSKRISEQAKMIVPVRAARMRLRPSIAQDSSTQSFAGAAELEIQTLEGIIATKDSALFKQVSGLNLVIAMERLKYAEKDSVVQKQAKVIENDAKTIKKLKVGKAIWKTVGGILVVFGVIQTVRIGLDD